MHTIVGTPQQIKFWDAIANESCHVVLEALAGTGKTTSIVEALRGLPPGLKVAFVCFSKVIATELQGRVPRGVLACTLHSLGGQAVARHTRRNLRDLVDRDKVAKMLPPLAASHVRSGVIKLTSLCKNTLVEPTNENLIELAAEYGIEFENSQKPICNLVRMCLDKSKSELGTIDFDDMLYLPVVLGLPLEHFDVGFVDESQDLNAVQQRMCFMAFDRMAVVGDRHQAIFRFRGADGRSMDTMTQLLIATGKDVKVLPLTVTQRCPLAVVREAQAIVPAFEARPDAIEGLVVHGSRAQYQLGDMVICRTNAPLIKEAYSCIAHNTPVKVQGRDFGRDLTKFILRLCARHDTVLTLSERQTEWRQRETERLLADKTKAISNEAKIQLLVDKCECIDALCEGMQTVQQVLDRIDLIFADVIAGTDKSKFVLLSSVHRAKGLEADIVHIIAPELMPHPMSTSLEELEQELNLKYVAITRAKKELHWH